MVDQILGAFEAAFTFYNLLAIVGGITLGIIIGAIPGLGSVTAMAVLIPVTYYMSPLASIAFLVGVNKGGTSGGAIPAIMLNSPGSPEAAATALDGYPMAKRGEAKRALKFAITSSVTGDMISDVLLILLVVPFAAIALQFGPLEYTMVFLFAFSLLSSITGDSPLKGAIAIFGGIFLSTIGLDPVHSTERMTFGEINLFDGLPLIPIAIGGLALASVLSEMLDIRRSKTGGAFATEQPKSGANTRLSVREFLSHWKTIIRSSLIGSFVGMLPGLGVTLAAFLSYGAARRASPRGNKFGSGEPEGIIATEAANSAVVGANLVPTIALGIPGNIAAALLIGALVMHGVVPGPFMLTMHGDLVYALFASMILANFVHFAVGRLGVNLWVHFATVPRGLILPPVLSFCIVGVYLPTQSLWDVGVMLAFAGLGLAMIRTRFSMVCLVIGFLLGEKFETSLRQTLLLYRGEYAELMQSPVAILFLLLSVGVMIRGFKRSRKTR